MFLTNNSPDLCVLTLCIKFRQNNLYIASLPSISANSNENYRRYNFQALANISGNFRKIYNPTANPQTKATDFSCESACRTAIIYTHCRH